MSMTGSGMGSSVPAPHKPTLGWSVAIIVGVVVLYHLTLGKK